jgi:hypothetical protein
MTKEQAEQLLRAALADFYHDDKYLLIHDVSERAITHKLAEHLKNHLPPEFQRVRDEQGVDHVVSVDCEYNRNGDGPKYLIEMQHTREGARDQLREYEREHPDEVRNDPIVTDDAKEASTTFPDIMVHSRGSNNFNYLIIEAKKQNNKSDHTLDHEKLMAFTALQGPNPYHYKFGVFIVFRTKLQNPPQPQITWFESGREA